MNNTNRRFVNFLEEFGWLLKNYAELNLTEEIEKLSKFNLNLGSEDSVQSNPNIIFLVGTLPSLFMNKDIFPNNESIVNFTEKVLKITITRWGKRSQYEIIGLVVCEVSSLDDNKLVKVVKELKRYVSNQTKPNNRQSNDWNEVIRRLTGEDKNV